MPDKNLAPIILFVYNRPLHTQKTIESLKKNSLAKDSVLYIFADGLKHNANNEDREALNKTRELIKYISGFKDVIVTENTNNQGLANSVIKGVTETVNIFGKVIVMEDDLVVSPFFLDYMNEGLNLYETSPNIYSINGYMFPLDFEQKESQVSLLPYISTWGWATWKSRWEVFNLEMPNKHFLKNNSYLKNRFNIGDYDYTGMLDFTNNSWGIKWYYSIFIRAGLNVFPTRSLVNNIGFDGTGTNGTADDKTLMQMPEHKINMVFKDSMDLDFFDAFINHFKKENISLPRRLTGMFRKS